MTTFHDLSLSGIMRSVNAELVEKDARIAELEAQNDWLKTAFAELQLPPTKRDHDSREKWLLQRGMPGAKAGGA